MVAPDEAASSVPMLASRARRRPRQLSLVEDTPRPLVKWAGGKAKLLPALLARMPAVLAGRYYEPFVGGGALLFAALPVRATIGDINAELIECYREVGRDPAGVHAQLRALFEAHAADRASSYYQTRAMWNSHRAALATTTRAATFLYLNRACFNGLWRVNRLGQMNVPIGRGANGGSLVCPSLAHLAAVSQALRGCQIVCADYAQVVAPAVRGDVVYFDPPYEPRSTSSSFTAYAAGGFGSTDHARLGALAVDLVARGVRVLVSGADVPGAADRYSGFAVHRVTAARAISACSRGRARVGELILVGGDEPSATRRSSP